MIGAHSAWKAEKLNSTDTLENNPNPAPDETGHEGHDHTHDHEHDHDHEHPHEHGPVLNPDCTRELVLDIPAEDVSEAFRTVTRNYRRHARIPGFRAGKVPETVIKRKFAAEIRKDVIDFLLPERFNKAVHELGVTPVGQPQVTELTVDEGQPLHVKAVFEFIPAFSIEGYKDVTVPKPPVEVTEEEFQQEMEQLRESRATVEPVEEDRELRDGDWAQISYTGKIVDDLERRTAQRRRCAGGNRRQGYGRSLLAALRGARLGQELKAEEIYPAEYPEAKLAGKTVDYEIPSRRSRSATFPN